MKPLYSYALIAAFAAVGQASAVEATTTPVGYVATTCLSGSDTIVGVPLKSPTVAAAALASAPASADGNVTTVLTVATSTFTAGALAGTHYVKITSGPDLGKIFPIVNNTATSVTVSLNGDTTQAVVGNTFSVTKFWTLAELFNPSVSTNDPLTTGNAIVSSSGTTAGTRRTEVLLPDTTTAGINLASAGTFYVNAGIWKKQGGGATDYGTQQVWPDNYFTIRNPATVTSSTNYVIAGEVDTTAAIIPLATRTGGQNEKQDNAVALTRPIDITLNQLNLGGTSAFVSSTGATAATRRDEVLVFDNAGTGLNKAASATYYFRDGIWNKQGGGVVDAGNDKIPAGSGIVIRKYGTAAGATALWNNTPSYSN